jgi:hypothetical protein
MSNPSPTPEPGPGPEPRAGILAVAKIMLSALLMIGKKGTWEPGGAGAQLTLRQIVIGAVIGGLLVVASLILLVRLVIGLAVG